MGALEASSRAAGPVRLAPRAVARPSTAADVAALVTWAAHEGWPLVPRAAGTGMPGGNVGRDVVVDLTGLDHLRWLGDGVCDVGPGLVAARLQAEAAARGRYLPALPSSADRCTLGGMIANDAAGARSFGHGPVHAFVEEVDVVLPDGSAHTLRAGEPGPPAVRGLLAEYRARWGGKPPGWPAVRKNASGYPLDRFLGGGGALALMIGSEGTLAIVTRARLRLPPRPERSAVALLPLPDEAHVADVVAALAPARAAACELLGRTFLDVAGLRDDPGVGDVLTDADGALLVEVDAGLAPVEDSLAHVRGVAASLGVPVLHAEDPADRRRLWAVRHAASPVIAERASAGLVSMQFIEDSVVPPRHLARYLAGLGVILADEETEAVLFGHAGDANVHVNPLVDVRRPEWRARVRRILDRTALLVRELGGTLAGEHGDGRIRAPLHPTVWGEPLADAFREVKEALDPASLLNPGVVVAQPGQDPLDGFCGSAPE